jgi:hypothetical protein
MNRSNLDPTLLYNRAYFPYQTLLVRTKDSQMGHEYQARDTKSRASPIDR